MAPTWDILICSIPHRDATMCALLGELDCQMRPGVGVIAYRDNLQVGYGSKCAALTRTSQADYVSFIDDDDMVAPDFIRRVLAALGEEPDYVGFPVRFTMNGALQMPVEHSLRHGCWKNGGDMLKRDIAQFNPIRRELAVMGNWEDGSERGWGAEVRWADSVRATGLCKNEVWIPDPMYYYQWSPGDFFQTKREPLPLVPPLPEYPWLTVLEP